MTITNFSEWRYSFRTKGTSTAHGLKIVSYYVVDNEPIMEFSIDKSSIFDMQMLESSFDLMQNPFSMQKRRWMMPTHLS
jgi:hypothetical protein